MISRDRFDVIIDTIETRQGTVVVRVKADGRTIDLRVIEYHDGHPVGPVDDLRLADDAEVEKLLTGIRNARFYIAQNSG